jgi:hypothetical protein
VKKKIEELYLQYFNQFLTIQAFASYHHISEKRAQRIIEIGRELNHRRSK